MIKAKKERSVLFDNWKQITEKLNTQIQEFAPESQYTQQLPDSDWKSGKLAILTSDNVIMNMSPKESKELREFSRDYNVEKVPKILPETDLNLSSEILTEEIKTYVKNAYNITDEEILKSQYELHKNLKKEYWPSDERMIISEYQSLAHTLDEVKTIDNIINKSIVPKDVIVYGVIQNNTSGNKMQVKNYVCASRTPNGARDIISSYDLSGFPMKILIKAGTPALFIEDFEHNLPEDRKTKGSEIDTNMREVILPRNLEYNVVTTENGNKILETIPTNKTSRDYEILNLEDKLNKQSFEYKKVKILTPGETRVEMANIVNTLSDSEKHRLVSYTSKGHKVYNQLSGDSVTKYTPEKEQQYSKEADELEAILNKTITPGKLNVIRGVDEEGWGRLHQMGAMEEDSEFQYNGFMSTSYSKSIAKQFAGTDKNGKRLYVAVTLPKGVPAAMVDRISAYKGEDEILINRKLMFKSLGVSEEDDSNEKILYIEAIPPERKDNILLNSAFETIKQNYRCKEGTIESGSFKCSTDEHLGKSISQEYFDKIYEEVENSDVMRNFSHYGDKWTSGSDAEARETAIAIAQDDKKLLSYLQHRAFGLEIPKEVTLYRVGTVSNGLTNSFFINKGAAESYQKRMGVDSIHAYKVESSDVVPSGSGSGEAWVPGDAEISEIALKDISEVLTDYQSYAYTAINDHLRGTDIIKQTPEQIDNIKKDVTVIDEEMTKHPLEHSIFVYRADNAGISVDAFEKTGLTKNFEELFGKRYIKLYDLIEKPFIEKTLRQNLVGYEYTEKAFMSTGTNMNNVRNRFLNPSPDIGPYGVVGFVELSVPKGINALEISKYTGLDSELGGKINEYLIDRDQTIVIDSVNIMPSDGDRLYIKYGAHIKTPNEQKLNYKCEKGTVDDSNKCNEESEVKPNNKTKYSDLPEKSESTFQEISTSFNPELGGFHTTDYDVEGSKQLRIISQEKEDNNKLLSAIKGLSIEQLPSQFLVMKMLNNVPAKYYPKTDGIGVSKSLNVEEMSKAIKEVLKNRVKVNENGVKLNYKCPEGTNGPGFSCGLTSEEKSVVEDYTRTLYGKVNAYLRKGENATNVLPKEREEVKHKINILESVINKSPLVTEEKVFKGIAEHTLGLYKNFDNLVGTVITEKGFCSTSTDVEIAAQHARSGASSFKGNDAPSKGIIAVITLPKGLSALKIGDSEGEILVQRGTSFKVLGASKEGSYWRVDMEAIKKEDKIVKTNSGIPESALRDIAQKVFNEHMKIRVK